jgi:hypothetical protein
MIILSSRMRYTDSQRRRNSLENTSFLTSTVYSAHHCCESSFIIVASNSSRNLFYVELVTGLGVEFEACCSLRVVRFFHDVGAASHYTSYNQLSSARRSSCARDASNKLLSRTCSSISSHLPNSSVWPSSEYETSISRLLRFCRSLASSSASTWQIFLVSDTSLFRLLVLDVLLVLMDQVESRASELQRVWFEGCHHCAAFSSRTLVLPILVRVPCCWSCGRRSINSVFSVWQA